MKTRAGSAVSPGSPTWFQRDVVAVVAAAGIGILLGFVRFPQMSGSPLPYIVLALVAMVVVGVPAGIILLAARASTRATQLMRSRSLLLSIALGVVWIVYTVVTHFIIPGGDQPTINTVLLWSVLLLTALALLVGSGTVARETRRFTTGFATGVATGFLTGVVAMLTILIMLDVGMGVLVQHMNTEELAGFASSGWANRQAWYYWNEEFFGSLGDFLLLVLSGVALGAVGAAIGWAFATTSLRSHHTQKERV